MSTVTYSNLVKRGGRWLVDGEATVTGTVADNGNYVTVSDPTTGHLLKGIAKYLVVKIEA